MTLTLEHITPEQEEVLRDTLVTVAALCELLGGWEIKKFQAGRRSATLYLTWDNDVSPLDLRSLGPIFQQAPSILGVLINKLTSGAIDPSRNGGKTISEMAKEQPEPTGWEDEEDDDGDGIWLPTFGGE